MRHTALSAFILASATIMLALPASAQTRSWVSGVGDDMNPCSRNAPCRTFSTALSKTSINGEINCIDAGGYGTLTITKSVTIDCTGTYASILAANSTGVLIDIKASGLDPHRSVRLRGLSINGTGMVDTVGTRTGLDGIRVVQANSVFVEDTVIGEFTQQGIKVGASASTNLTLDNVVIRNADGSGVTLSTSTGQVVASLNNVRIDGTPIGLSAAGNVRANIRNMVLSHAATGIQTGGKDNVVNVDNMMVSFATTAVMASPGSTVRLSNSAITQNTTGLDANGGSIVSMSANSLTGNTTDGVFTGSVSKL